jgi:hypothetical protein
MSLRGPKRPGLGLGFLVFFIFFFSFLIKNVNSKIIIIQIKLFITKKIILDQYFYII